MNGTGEMPELQLTNGVPVRTQPPVFITGSGRCGTTLMRRLLMEASAIAIPPENYTIAQTSALARKNRNDWTATCEEVVGHLSRDEAVWALFKLDRHLLLNELSSLPPEHRSLVNIWHVFHALWAESNGRDGYVKWGDKTPNNAHHLPKLLKLFPDADFIFMVRDPYDTVLSMLESLEGAYTPVQAALRWKSANEDILNFVGSRNCRHIFVRYEDLVANPNEQVSKCLAFLGLSRLQGASVSTAMPDVDYWPHLANTFRDVTADSVSRGRRKLDDAAIASVSEICGPLSNQLKYDTPRE